MGTGVELRSTFQPSLNLKLMIMEMSCRFSVFYKIIGKFLCYLNRFFKASLIFVLGYIIVYFLFIFWNTELINYCQDHLLWSLTHYTKARIFLHWNLSDNLKLVFYLQQFSNFEIRFWLAFFPVPIEFRTFFPVIYFNRKTALYWCYVNWRFSDSISSEWMVAVSVFSSLFLQLKNCLCL